MNAMEVLIHSGRRERLLLLWRLDGVFHHDHGHGDEGSGWILLLLGE